MNRRLERAVRQRAGGRCEYCHLPEHASPLKHVTDHIVAEQHHGSTTLGNLAFCCVHCNLHKGPNLAGIDPSTKRVRTLFNPRKQPWTDHFRWRGVTLVGRTPTGRATIDVLAINAQIRLGIRSQLAERGIFPTDFR
jgi:hypothetical protein